MAQEFPELENIATFDSWDVRLTDPNTVEAIDLGIALCAKLNPIPKLQPQIAMCIADFYQGMRDIYNDYKPRIRSLQFPTFSILYNTTDNMHLIGHISKRMQVYISDKALLSHAPYYDSTNMHHFNSHNGLNSIGIRASVSDYYYLCGVEETHHHIYDSVRHLRAKPNFDKFPLHLSDDEYHLLSYEYLALRARIRMAKRKKMNDETINDLIAQLNSTQQLRRESKDL